MTLETTVYEKVVEVEFYRSSEVYNTILFVEGDTDRRLLKKFVKDDACIINITGSKDLSLAIANKIIKRKIKGVLFVVDRDFDHLRNINHSNDFILYYDYNDSEMMTISSEAFNSILTEYSSADKVKQIGGADRVKNRILDICSDIGRLRLYSHIKNKNYKFSDHDLDGLCKKSMEFKLSIFTKHILNKSKLYSENVEEILHECQSIELSDEGLECNGSGHDAVKIVSAALARWCGSCDAKSVAPEALEALLRSAYNWKEFSQSQLYGHIQAWEWANKPFKVLN